MPIRSNDDQINIRPRKAKFGCMGAIYSNFTERHSFLNDSCDIFDDLLFERLHLVEYFFDRVTEL